MVFLLPDLLFQASVRWPQRLALVPAQRPEQGCTYAELARRVAAQARAWQAAGLQRGDRVGVYLDKRVDTVVACWAAAALGAVFVPVNPVLKGEQVAHVLSHSGAVRLVTTPQRWAAVQDAVEAAMQAAGAQAPRLAVDVLPEDGAQAVLGTGGEGAEPPALHFSPVDTDLAALFYTSGSTGLPKGVMVSHRNLVVGAASVASYLGNHDHDVLLAALPLSFDAGFSQLTTAFHSGACVVLLNPLLPQDLMKAVLQHRITGLTAVPPLFHQLAALAWPPGVDGHLRYFASTGGVMPASTLQALRRHWPRSQPVLMYGLTEAFRSTYLPPSEVDRRPGSMGRAIPNAEVLVLDEQGRECAPGEVGELVHRGPLVTLGYWNDPERTAERFKPLPAGVGGRPQGAVLPELAVYSGDRVRRDEEGFLYFVGRRDEMIKTSGYRVSPAEVEAAVLAVPGVLECVACGVAHEALGQVIHVQAQHDGRLTAEAVRQACRQRLPAYMVPAVVHLRTEPLPRNPNGKLDRVALAAECRP